MITTEEKKEHILEKMIRRHREWRRRLKNTICQLCGRGTYGENRYTTSSGNAFHKKCIKEEEKT